MSDRRLTPANGRVAAERLRGHVKAQRFVAGEARRVAVPVADLDGSPGGTRDRQLLWGEGVLVYEVRDGMAFVEAGRDGYVGYVSAVSLGPDRAPTHRVAVPATHLYRDDDMKSPDLHHLSFGALVMVEAEGRKFWETPEGYIPKPHLRPLDRPFTDPAAVAQLHFGVPYLWGGNSVLGIDCSGLAQAACLACGIACPGDSDLQRALGSEIPEGEPLRRGDLVFWKGHVGMMVDEGTLIHANAHHMAVAYEPLDRAIARITAQGEGAVLARRRL
ncbi:NlpC/P60 family protein [Rubellimicrobium roseum]|uniref:NlpC/P60 family protein n=1 Tax=Rubellimicrobium roseum TaxID=687525 RepID=A0A5C4NAI5_9RHOB|nr:NlpC/P60 family protein [Rubellimicrobium roseum]TNC64513.1 NlpC/P60 family protein [Rubellimicrobium roseum]